MRLLLSLMLKPSRLADVKPSFLRYRHSGIKVGSTIEFLPETCIVLELGKQG